MLKYIRYFSISTFRRKDTLVFSPGYLFMGISSTIAGVMCLLFAIRWFIEYISSRGPARATRRPWPWISLFTAALVLISGGFWLNQVAVPPNVLYRLEVQAVATTDSGEIYLITPHDTAVRCAVATECVELKPGDVVLYHPVKSTRSDIIDVRKG